WEDSMEIPFDIRVAGFGGAGDVGRSGVRGFVGRALHRTGSEERQASVEVQCGRTHPVFSDELRGGWEAIRSCFVGRGFIQLHFARVKRRARIGGLASRAV